MRIALDADDLAPVTTLLTDIRERINRMATLTQAQLDALTARLDAATAGLRADIDALKAAHPDVDTSALEAKLAALEALDAEHPETSPEPPPPSA